MKLCMGCMQNMDERLTTCPHCGFDETTLRQESYYLDPGTVVGGKYIVGRVLAYGGHTVSYLGLDAEKNQKIVVKEYLPSDFSTRADGETDVTIYSGDAQEQFETGLTSFLNEANRIQQLGETEGIARIYDCLAENETGYVISEYVEGRTLKEILDAGKKFSPEEAKQFIVRILQGLCRVHPLDIIHCDISPETIMVTNTGEIKLMDFGATRYVTTANSKSLAIILKQGYAPEEQYRSKGVRGPWTDVYALAAVMYRMITGRVPQESVDRALVDSLEPPSKLGISIPENMENALMNALNVFQDERTKSADAFLKELTSSTVKRIHTKRKYESGKFPGWAKVLVACIACVIVAGGILLFHNMRVEPNIIESDAVHLTAANKSVEELKNRVDELNKEHDGWKLQLKKKKDWDAYGTGEKNGMITQISVDSTIDLTNPEEVNDSGSGLKAEAGEDGRSKVVKGTIEYGVYTDKEVRYREIAGMNAYQIAELLEGQSEKAIGNNAKRYEDAGQDKPYYELKEIRSGDQVITANDLVAEENANEVISVDDNLRIAYYTGSFFYWKSFPANEYKKEKNVKELEASTYILDTAGKRVETGKKEKLDDVTDDGYYSFTAASGTIIKYKNGIEDGDEVDSREQGKFICAVGEQLSYSGKNYYDLKNEIKNIDPNINVSFGGGAASQPVIAVEVTNNDDPSIRSFKKGQNVTITIECKVKPKPVQPSTGGSSGGGSSSGSGSGSGGGSSSGSGSGFGGGNDFQ